jgi:hypothetical protein
MIAPFGQVCNRGRRNEETACRLSSKIAATAQNARHWHILLCTYAANGVYLSE